MTVAKIATVVNRGIRGEVDEPLDYCHLDLIIAVGFRGPSLKTTNFRKWAKRVLNEYM